MILGKVDLSCLTGIVVCSIGKVALYCLTVIVGSHIWEGCFVLPACYRWVPFRKLAYFASQTRLAR
jgi:hypothetical protein